MSSLRRQARAVRRHPVVGDVLGLTLPRAGADAQLRRFGTVYGGAWISTGGLARDSICYVAGVGTDVSFEIELIDRLGAQVWAFDPTPSVVQWVAGQEFPTELTYSPVGVYDRDGVERFYAPADSSHVSHSIDNIQLTKSYFEGTVRRVATIMQTNGHQHLDLLKLNIEGAEGRVLYDVFTSGIRPKQLSVVFEQRESLRKLRNRVLDIISNGYEILHVEGWHYLFSELST